MTKDECKRQNECPRRATFFLHSAFCILHLAGQAGFATQAAVPSGETLTARDFEFNYDQPAFYALLQRMREQSAFPPAGVEPRDVNDWREFLARPADFRGQIVRITGTLGRNKDSFRLLQRPDLGSLTQLELERAGNAVTATVVCTQDVADLPVGALLEVVGYFVLVRNYHTDSRRVAQSAVIVAPGPVSVSTAAAPARTQTVPSGLWIGLAVTLVAALAITWLLIRRAVRTPPMGLSGLQATEAAPFQITNDDESFTKPGDEPSNEPFAQAKDV